MDFMEFIGDNVYVLVPVIYVIGTMLKQTPKVPDWLIPYILSGIGVVLAILILQDILQGVIQGVLVTAVAVYGHNLIKQIADR